MSITIKQIRVGSILKNQWNGIKRTVIGFDNGMAVVKNEECDYPGISGTVEYLSHFTYETLIQF